MGPTTNKLTAAKYEISRESLKYLLQSTVDQGRKIEAIKLLRACTGWGLKESKDYVESGMVDAYKAGDRVTIGYSNEEHRIESVLSHNGTTWYWLVDYAGNPCTYGARDITGLAA